MKIPEHLAFAETYCEGKPRALRLYVGCTRAQHARLGIHAVINARGGQLWRNDLDRRQEIEEQRDARALRDHIERRVAIHSFGSRTCRKRPELKKFLSE